MLDVIWVAIPALTSLLYAILLYNLSGPGRYIEPAERWRAAFLLAATLWSLTSLLLHAAYRAVSPTLLVRLWALTNFAIPLTINGFVAHFLALRRAQRLAIVGVLLYIPITYLIAAGYAVSQAEMVGGQFRFITGPALPLLGLFWAFYMYSAGFYVLRERMRTRSPEFRQRLDYLLAVVVLLTLGNTLNITPLSSYPVDILLAGVAAILMGLSVSRNHLLAVRSATMRVLGFVLFGVAYVASAAFLLYVLSQLAEWALALAAVVVTIATGLVVSSYAPVRRRLTRLVERYFLAEYDIEPLLLRLSRVGTRLKPPQELAQIVLRDIRQFFGIAAAALFLEYDEDATYRLVAVEGIDLGEREIRFQADSPLIAILSRRQEAITLAALAEMPEARGLWIREWDMLRALRAEVLVPIFAEEGLIGFFTFGPREGGLAYSRRELEQTFPLLAGQVSIAMDNSRLYAQVRAKAEELARANEELKELDRIKTEIIQNVSHELRTPLTLIMGYAELLEQGIIEGEEDVREAGRLMLTHARHLRRLVEQLLAFQRMERSGISLYPFDLYAWLQDVITAWRPALSKAGLELVAEVEPDVDGVVGNESYLRQVVDNLLDNARKFSPDGGRITLRAWRDRDEVYISVSDQGIGVPPDKLPRLFDRFYQVDASPRRKYGGMGIGLALCKEIVERHGGRIWAESAGPGKGLTVTFTLPINVQASAENTAEARLSSAVQS